jgi:hypothetical protein
VIARARANHAIWFLERTTSLSYSFQGRRTTSGCRLQINGGGEPVSDGLIEHKNDEYSEALNVNARASEIGEKSGSAAEEDRQQR